MAYIGNNPADIGVYAVQAETGNGVLTAFTLDRAATTASILVSIDGVDQIPTTAYAVTVGTTLTFTSPPPNLSVISIRFLGDTVTFGEPSDNSVTDAKVADNALSGNKIDGGTISNFASTGIDDNADAVAITIDSGEQVGIGTTSPADLVHIVGGDLRLEGTSAQKELMFKRSDATAPHGKISYLDSAGTQYWTIGSNLRAGPGWEVSEGAGQGTNRLYVAPGGNVGIGTDTGVPGAKLEVGGQVKITGGSPGADKVLTSDANGLASWATPTGGLFESYAVVADRVAQNNYMATVTSGDWRELRMQTEIFDPDNLVTFDGTGRIELIAGTYMLRAFKQVYRGNGMSIRWYDHTGSAVVDYGFTTYLDAVHNFMQTLVAICRVTHGSANQYALQQKVTATTQGPGGAANHSIETYCYFEIYKENT